MSPSVQLRLLLFTWLCGLILGAFIPFVLGSFVAAALGFALYVAPSWRMGVLAGFTIAMTYSAWYAQTFYPQTLAPLVGEKITLRATVQGEVKVRHNRQTVRLKINAWQPQINQWQPLSAQVLWSHAPLPALSPGDQIVVTGVVTNLTRFSADFDIQAYYARWGIAQQLIRAELLSRPPPTPALNQTWRATAQNRLESHLNRPHLTVALGMLVGLKEKLPKSLDAAFKASGLQHLLVVSGTNVTLLILALSLVLKPLGPWWRYGVGVLAIGAYLYLVGFDPPALRASLFGVITGLALTSGYFCEYRNIFLLVAALLCTYDPYFIIHDVSFHLSFGATAGILFGVPLVYPALKPIPWPKVKLLLAASFCAQMAVFPILITQFGSFPYAGLFTNLLTEPLVPLIMFLAAGGVLIGGQFLAGLETVWSMALWASIEGLIKLAQLASLLQEVFIAPTIGLIWGVLLLMVAVWAAFSQYYQTQFWEKLEAEIG